MFEQPHQEIVRPVQVRKASRLWMLATLSYHLAQAVVGGQCAWAFQICHPEF